MVVLVAGYWLLVTKYLITNN